MSWLIDRLRVLVVGGICDLSNDWGCPFDAWRPVPIFNVKLALQGFLTDTLICMVMVSPQNIY